MVDPVTPASDEPIGVLVHRLAEQVPELVRTELRLAQAELTAKGKQAGAGAGLLGVAGLLSYLALVLVTAAAVLALALVWPAWLAALVMALVLLVIAGVVTLAGRRRVRAATPAAPERTITGVREDVAALRGRHR